MSKRDAVVQYARHEWTMGKYGVRPVVRVQDVSREVIEEFRRRSRLRGLRGKGSGKRS